MADGYGSPLDLIHRPDVSDCEGSIEQGKKVRLATANGETVSSEVLPLRLERLGEDILPYVLKSTPNVLSLGRRIIIDGFSFY